MREQIDYYGIIPVKNVTLGVSFDLLVSFDLQKHFDLVNVYKPWHLIHSAFNSDIFKTIGFFDV